MSDSPGKNWLLSLVDRALDAGEKLTEPRPAPPPTEEPPHEDASTTTEPSAPQPKNPHAVADTVASSMGRFAVWFGKTFHKLNRDFYGAEAFGAIAGIASTEVPDLLPDNTNCDPSDVEEPPTPSGLSAQFEKRIEEQVTSLRQIRRYRAAMARTASQPINPGSNVSRLEFAEKSFEKSKLPESLQKLLPFVPFEESDYRLTTPPNRPAQGPWQFIPGTARRYGLVSGEIGKRGYQDHRSDFVRATKAAVEYFEDLHNDLKDDPNYKILKKRYHLSEDDFLVPATVNAFNSGVGHMKLALKVMATEKSIRNEVDKYATSGIGGLYSYMTDVYIYDFKTWQKPHFKKGFYHKESAAYFYKIEGFHRLHRVAPEQALVPSDNVAEGTETMPNPAGIDRKKVAVIGGITAGVSYAAAMALRPKHSRRDFLSLAGRTATASMAGMGGALLDLSFGDDIQAALSHNNPELSRINNFSGLDPYSKKNAVVLEQAGFDHAQIKRYTFNQKMGDKAFELYQQTSDSDYLILSEYYYRHALELAEGQKGGRYALPGGGLSKVEERIRYCSSAHSIVDSEF